MIARGVGESCTPQQGLPRAVVQVLVPDGRASPLELGKTRSHMRCFAVLRRCCLRAANATLDSRMVRRPALLLGVVIAPSYTLRFTRSVPASRSMSLHWSPNNSPCLMPVVIASTYRASSLLPLAASRSVRICSLVSGSISRLTGRGGIATSATLRLKSWSLMASLSTLRMVAWM